MAFSADTFLKVSIAGALLIAASGVGFYYGIHLPSHDSLLDQERHQAQLRAELRLEDDERRKEEARKTEIERQEEQQRLDLAQKATDRASADRRQFDSQRKYEACLSNARANYVADWTAACKLRAHQIENAIRDCQPLALPAYKVCVRNAGVPDPTFNCALPATTSKNLDELNEKNKDRCLRERQAGL